MKKTDGNTRKYIKTHKNSIRVQNWTPGFNYFTRGAHRGTSTSGYHAHFTDGKDWLMKHKIQQKKYI